MIYNLDGDGRYHLPSDSGQDTWRPETPVVMVSWECAFAYASWLRDHSHRPWRLLSEWEWEKAARGVDGRRFPWGNRFDPAWCRMSTSTGTQPMISEIGEHRVDCSPYGVRATAGNVAEWCSTAYREFPDVVVGTHVRPKISTDPGPRVCRGGHWLAKQGACATHARTYEQPSHRSAHVGFRVARSLPE
jgi:serine/threonine-protein kinase